MSEPSNEKTVELSAQEAQADHVYTLDCGSVKTEYCDALLKLGEVLTELHNATRREKQATKAFSGILAWRSQISMHKDPRQMLESYKGVESLYFGM